MFNSPLPMMTHKNPNSPTSLTEFAPHSADVRQSAGLLSRIFKRTADPNLIREDLDQAVNDDDMSTDDGDVPNGESLNGKADLSSSCALEASGVVMEPPARTLPSVLMRLRRIIAGSGQTPQAYKDSDFKQYWMPDSNCRECYECSSRFHAFRRRHHCRICGQIFCSQCCNKEVPGKIMGFTGSLRVCTYCCEVVLNYAENLDGASDDLEEIVSLPDSQRVINRESSESPSRTTVGQTDANLFPNNLNPRSFKTPRLSSIFDEDLKRSCSSTDLESALCNVGNCREEHKAILQDSVQLRDLWLLMTNTNEGIGAHTHRSRLRSYSNCMLGRHIVDWLIDKDKAMTREQAVALGQVLLDTRWLESTSINDPIFRDDYTSYRPAEMALRDGNSDLLAQSSTLESDGDDEPQWFREIKQNYSNEQTSELLAELNKIPSTVSAPRDDGLDNNVTNSIFFVDAPLPCDSMEQFEQSQPALMTTICSSVDSRDTGELFLAGSSVVSGSSGIFQETSERIPVDNSSGDPEESDHSGEGHSGDLQGSHYRNQLSKLQKEHLTLLVMQMLHKSGLSTKWAETILATAQKVGQTVRPEVRFQREANEMDIRQYVRIKKVPGGVKSNTAIINGVVCTKNVAHKKMRQQMTNPRVLLLRAPIEYQRIENKFSSLEPQILQENEFLKNCVSRIAKIQPDILLVEKTVSRLAQGFLLDAGITLVLNVKASVMERVARMSQAVIASSIDGLVTKTTMGSCRSFYLKAFTLPDGASKTLMYFDGCEASLGCTVTLRGGSLGELRRVKQILNFMIYASYHSGLELEFLMNELAIPPQMESSPSELIEDITPDDANDPQQLPFVGQQCSREPVYEDVDVNSDSVFLEPSDQEPALNDETGESLGAESVVSEMQEEQNVRGRGTVTSELVTDSSDPLHSYQLCKDETIFNQPSTMLLMEDKRHTCQQFKKALNEVVLTISPCVKFDLPYLETETGSKCKLRSCFPSEIFWSEVFHPETSSQFRRKLSDVENVAAINTNTSLFNIELLPKHPFITDKLSSPVTDLRIQAELADFRARGGRIPFEGTQNGFIRKNGVMIPSQCSTQQPTDTDVEKRVDCLDPFLHQRICLLFSSYSDQSINAPNPCVFPWTVTMSFYSRTDITLGGFLEKYCFSESYRCVSKSCDTPMVDHVRRFAHGNICIQVVLKKLDAQLFYPSEAIYIWNWCRKCKRVSPKILLSPEAHQMSFAKYLELRFHGNKYLRRSNGTCRHSIHHDHLQYFGNQQIITSFKCSTITLKEVVLPPIVIGILPPEFTLQQLEDEGKMLNFRTTSVYVLILEQLHRLKKEASSDSQSNYITELVMEVEKEKDSIVQKIEYVQSLITDGKRLKQDADYNLGVQVQDAFVEIKHQVAEVVTAWNERIHEAELQQKKNDKSRALSSASISTTTGATASANAIANAGAGATVNANAGATANATANANSRSGRDSVIGSVSSNVSDNFSMQVDDGAVVVTMNDEEQEDIAEAKTSVSTNGAVNISGSLATPPFLVATSDNTATYSSPFPLTTGDSSNPVPDVIVTSWLDAGVDLLPDKTSPSFNTTASSLDLKGSFESSSPPKSSSTDQNDQTSSSQTTSVFSQPRSRSSNDLRKVKGISKDGTLQELEKKDRATAVKQIFSSLFGSGNTTVPIPFPSEEHHLLSLSCQKVPVVVYDQEPSSIIAFALSSYDYERQLQELKTTSSSDASSLKRGVRLGDSQTDADVKRGVVSFLKANNTPSREKSPNRSVGKFQVDTVMYTPNSDRDSLEETDEVDGFQTLGDALQKSGGKLSKQIPQNFHIELQFSDCNAKFYCRVCYAEQFAKLRKLIFPEGEERFIRSLSRCFTWLARGGKSGSSFCKTQDDRFILKQMSKIEVQNFTEFAPHYFQYVTKAYEAGKPTAIAKILGVYRIGFQNSKTAAALKQDLLVMENLFYSHKINKIFDLKGSSRNRLVNTSGKRVEDVVLLDVNLVKTSIESPLYVFPHSKAVLMASISLDTEFLSSHSVMDYSLLVGVNDTDKQLVIGIIDYIRTFTWDKKVEMIVKTAYGKEAPTVVSPEDYKRRFFDAMERYFLLVPDRWHGLGQGIK